METNDLLSKRKKNYLMFKNYVRSLVVGYHVAIYNDTDFVITIKNVQFTEYDINLLTNLSNYLSKNEVAFGCTHMRDKQQISYVL